MEYTLSIAMTRTGKFIFVKKESGPMEGKAIFVGGKVEPHEDAFRANAREFKEELGYDTKDEDWYPIATIRYPSYVLHVFLLSGTTLRDSLVPSTTDAGETVVMIDPEWFDDCGYEVDGLCKMLIQEVVLKV